MVVVLVVAVVVVVPEWMNDQLRHQVSGLVVKEVVPMPTKRAI